MHSLCRGSTKYILRIYKRPTEDNWHMNHEEDKVDQVAFPTPKGHWG